MKENDYSISCEYVFRPRFSDMDSYMIAHHSNYFCWFEEARFYFLQKKMGLSAETISDLKIPVIDIFCKYHRPVEFGSEYVILLKVSGDYDNYKFQCDYRLLSSNKEKQYAKGYSTHVFLDNGEIMTRLPDDILAKFMKLVGNE